MSLTSVTDNPGSEPGQDNMSFTITEISDIKSEFKNENIETQTIDSKSFSVKSRISEIETIQTPKTIQKSKSASLMVEDTDTNDIIIDRKSRTALECFFEIHFSE